MNDLLSEFDFLVEDIFFRVLSVVNDVSLSVIAEKVENSCQEKRLRVGILQLLCLETIYKEEADQENKEVNTMYGKEAVGHDNKECFQENGF